MTSRTEAVVGERGPEAIMPLSRLESIITEALSNAALTGRDQGVMGNPSNDENRLIQEIRRLRDDVRSLQGESVLKANGRVLAEEARRNDFDHNLNRVISE